MLIQLVCLTLNYFHLNDNINLVNKLKFSNETNIQVKQAPLQKSKQPQGKK